MSIKKTIISASILSLTLNSGLTMAFSQDELTIWMGGDKAYKGMEIIGQRFEEKMGIPVKVEIPENLPDRFQQAAATGKGPDIVLWAHDRFGEWADSGLLAAVQPSSQMQEGFEQKGWQAISHKGNIYGYPIAMEAISLIYNKDLIDKAPDSFEAMFDLKEQFNKQGIATILWDQGNPYFTTPLLVANGGYVFKETPAGYDVKDIGINSKGAIEGGNMLARLLDEQVMPRGVDYGVMEASFNKGEAAMMISGPWAWANLEKSGINYGIAPLPKISGSPARALVGVWAAGLNNASPNKAVAEEFITHYLLTQEGLETLNTDRALGVVAHQAYLKKLVSDPRIAATYDNVVHGLLMPNVPQMNKFWSATQTALANIITEQDSVEVALNNAARVIGQPTAGDGSAG